MKLALFNRPKQLLTDLTNGYSSKPPKNGKTFRNLKICVADEKRKVEECDIIPSKEKSKLYPSVFSDGLQEGPIVCPPAIEKVWNIPEDCPPPPPPKPPVTPPLKRLKKTSKLAYLGCPSRKICPPRADDDWQQPAKILPCLPLSTCPQIEPEKMRSVNFTRMKKTPVFQKVVECEALAKCDDKLHYLIPQKNLPKLVAKPCPCVPGSKPISVSLKRLCPRPVAPPRAKQGPCPPGCDEEVKSYIARKLLPCLVPTDCPPPPPPADLKCCPLRRLPKVHQHAQVPECKEQPQCRSVIADEVCEYEPKRHRLPSLILCERHNKMSTRQYNMLKELGQNPDARKDRRAR